MEPEPNNTSESSRDERTASSSLEARTKQGETVGFNSGSQRTKDANEQRRKTTVPPSFLSTLPLPLIGIPILIRNHIAYICRVRMPYCVLQLSFEAVARTPLCILICANQEPSCSSSLCTRADRKCQVRQLWVLVQPIHRSTQAKNNLYN